MAHNLIVTLGFIIITLCVSTTFSPVVPYHPIAEGVEKTVLGEAPSTSTRNSTDICPSCNCSSAPAPSLPPVAAVYNCTTRSYPLVEVQVIAAAAVLTVEAILVLLAVLVARKMCTDSLPNTQSTAVGSASEEDLLLRPDEPVTVPRDHQPLSGSVNPCSVSEEAVTLVTAEQEVLGAQVARRRARVLEGVRAYLATTEAGTEKEALLAGVAAAVLGAWETVGGRGDDGPGARFSECVTKTLGEAARKL